MSHPIPPPGEAPTTEPRPGDTYPPHAEPAGHPPAELVEGVSRAIADYVQGARPPAGSMDLSREMTLILRQTADQLDSLRETQTRIAESLADTRQQELSLQTIKSLNYAFRELTESQERLAQELGEQRRRGRMWALFAVLLSALVVAVLLTLFGFTDLREQMNAGAEQVSVDRAKVDRAIEDIRSELDDKTRTLNEGALDFAHLAENMSELQRAKHAEEIATLATRHDEELFAQESRLAEVTRDRDIQANTLQALESSATRTGEAMKKLADERAELERRVQLAEGRLAAYETERPAREEEIAPSDIRWEPPEPASPASSAVDRESEGAQPAPGPPAEAISKRFDPPRSPPPPAPPVVDAAPSALADLVARHARDQGLRVVSAQPGDEPGTFRNVVFEKLQGPGSTQVTRKYRGQTARLLLVRADKVWVRMSGGALTLVGWRADGTEFSRDVDFQEFDLQLEMTDRQAWIQAGAVPLETSDR